MHPLQTKFKIKALSKFDGLGLRTFRVLLKHSIFENSSGEGKREGIRPDEKLKILRIEIYYFRSYPNLSKLVKIVASQSVR